MLTLRQLLQAERYMQEYCPEKLKPEYVLNEEQPIRTVCREDTSGKVAAISKETGEKVLEEIE